MRQKFLQETDFIKKDAKDLMVLTAKIKAKESGAPMPKFHVRHFGVGTGGGQFGFHMESTICGPVEEVEISSQVQFMEWLGLE